MPVGNTTTNAESILLDRTYNITAPSFAVAGIYQGVSAIVGIFSVYVLVAMCSFEFFYPKKPKGGKNLRLIVFASSFVELIHQIVQQLLVTISGRSNFNCFILMLTKISTYQMVTSLTYAFFWVRQHSLYSNQRLKHLRSKKMDTATWIALFFIIVNPFIVFGLQFSDGLYEIRNNVCLILKQPITVELLFDVVATSYAFIQMTLLFVLIYPLCKQRFSSANRNETVSSAPSQQENKASTADAGKASTASSIGNPRKSTKRTIKKRKYETYLKKWIVLSFICIITDISSGMIFVIYQYVYDIPRAVEVLFVWLDISQLINIFCMFLCFAEYRSMLLPFCSWNSQQERRLTMSSSSKEQS